MLSLLLLQTALATGITFDEVACPLGGAPARRFHKIAANRLGGFDSDLVSYSTKGQFRTHAISTCPDSLYSVYGDHIEREVTEAERPAVEQALAKAKASLKDPEEPEVWERYVLAAHVYEALGRGHLDLAQIYIEGSWTARDAAVGVYVGGLNGPEAAKKILETGQAELAKPLTDSNRKTVLYSLARVAHRAGEHAHREVYLDRFAKLSPTPDEASAMKRFRYLAQEVEPALQDMAISHLRAGLEQRDLQPIQVAHATYMLADLLRRRMEPKEALVYYRAVLEYKSLPPDIRQMATFFVKELSD